MPFFDATISVAVSGKDRKEAAKRLTAFLESNGWPCNVERLSSEPVKTEGWIDFVDDFTSKKDAALEAVRRI